VGESRKKRKEREREEGDHHRDPNLAISVSKT
jgi:hypothetical protein